LSITEVLTKLEIGGKIMGKMKELQNEKVGLKYAKWLLSECSEPIDEIEYLFDNLPEKEKEQIKNDLINWKS